MNTDEYEVVKLKGRTLSGDPHTLRRVECDPHESMTWCHVCGAVGFAKRHSTKVMCRTCAGELE